MGTDETYDGAMRRTVAHELVSTELVRDCHRLADKVASALKAGEAPEVVALDFACFAATWQLQALRTDLRDLIEDVGDVGLAQNLGHDICGSPQLESDYLNRPSDDCVIGSGLDGSFWAAWHPEFVDADISDGAMAMELAAA